MPRVQLLAVITYGSVVVSMFLGEFPKSILFLFIYEKEKGNLTIGMPKGSGFIKLSFKALKAVLSGFAHKIGLGLVLLSKT